MDAITAFLITQPSDQRFAGWSCLMFIIRILLLYFFGILIAESKVESNKKLE